MSLSVQEFERLESLSYINLSTTEKEKFLQKMNSIIDFIHAVDGISLNEVSDQQLSHPTNYMHIASSSQEKFLDVDRLFANAQHEKAGNGILIKSVFE